MVEGMDKIQSNIPNEQSLRIAYLEAGLSLHEHESEDGTVIIYDSDIPVGYIGRDGFGIARGLDNEYRDNILRIAEEVFENGDQRRGMSIEFEDEGISRIKGYFQEFLGCELYENAHGLSFLTRKRGEYTPPQTFLLIKGNEAYIPSDVFEEMGEHILSNLRKAVKP